MASSQAHCGLRDPEREEKHQTKLIFCLFQTPGFGGWGWGGGGEADWGESLSFSLPRPCRWEWKNIKHCHHQSPSILAITNIITLAANTIVFLPPSCHYGYDCLNLAVKQVTIRSKPLTYCSSSFTPIKFGIHPVFILWYGCQDRLLILLHTFVPLNFSQHQLAKCEVCLVSWECAPLSILLHCAVCPFLSTHYGIPLQALQCWLCTVMLSHTYLQNTWYMLVLCIIHLLIRCKLVVGVTHYGIHNQA